MFRYNMASVCCCSAQQLVMGRVVTISKLLHKEVFLSGGIVSCNKCNSTYIMSTSYQFLLGCARSYIPLLHGEHFSYHVHFLQYPLIEIIQKT